MQEFLAEKREQIVELCRAHHVTRLAVFGSAARDDFDPQRSDVDLLVEVETTDSPFTLAKYMRELQDGLESLLRFAPTLCSARRWNGNSNLSAKP